MRVAILLLLLAGGPALGAPSLRTVDVDGDLRVAGPLRYQDTHLRVKGSILLEKDGTLELDGCTVELLGSYDRQFAYVWKGGRLVTRRTALGGTAANGAWVHTTFNLADGEWDAEDTTIQYSYGICFAEGSVGKLRARRLIRGPGPDSIILSGRADVTLEESTFAIALNLNAAAGGTTTLDLPVDRPIARRVFDQSVLPGVRYRLELRDVTVPDFWFLFFRNISMDAPPAEVVLRNCPKVLPSLLGHNLAGEVALRPGLEQPLRLGNLTLRRAEQPVDAFCLGVYFSGEKTDVTLRGPIVICELMLWGGKVTLAGTPGTRDATCTCTTVDLHGKSVLQVRDARLGRPLQWLKPGERSPIIGQVTVADQAKLLATDVSLGRLKLIARGQGSLRCERYTKTDEVQSREEGGSITFVDGK